MLVGHADVTVTCIYVAGIECRDALHVHLTPAQALQRCIAALRNCAHWRLVHYLELHVWYVVCSRGGVIPAFMLVPSGTVHDGSNFRLCANECIGMCIVLFSAAACAAEALCWPYLAALLPRQGCVSQAISVCFHVCKCSMCVTVLRTFCVLDSYITSQAYVHMSLVWRAECLSAPQASY
jgi:hypothetical protein